MRTALYCTLYYRRLGLISIVPRRLRMSTTTLAAVTTNNDNHNKNSTSLRDTFQQLRNNPHQVFLLDGGTGEELFRHGVPDDRKLWSATALVKEDYHDALQQVHASFLQAGAQAITTNSYGVVPGVGFTPEERTKYIGVAGRIARQAVASHPTGGFVFGSLGPLVESYRPDKIQEHAQGVADYTLACQALYQEQIPQPQQVDAFLAETMSCVAESAQAVEAVASSLADPPPLLVSYTLDPKGNFRDGQDVTAGLRQLLDIVKDQHKVELLAVLFNCAEPEAITLALAKIAADTELRQRLQDEHVLLGAYANRLTQVNPNWTLADSQAPQPFRHDLTAQQYWHDFLPLWMDQLGVQLVGGCCGMTPEHIAYIRTQLDQRNQQT